MINLPGCIVLPPGVAKIFQIRKIQRFDKSDTDVTDMIIGCFGREDIRNQLSEMIFKQLISL